MSIQTKISFSLSKSLVSNPIFLSFNETPLSSFVASI